MTGEQLTLLQIEAAGTRLLLAAGTLVEVIARPDVTHVPAMPPWVSGVANLRGVVLTVVDLAPFLGLGAAVITARSCLLVLEGTRGQANTALGADRVGRLHSIDQGAIERLPEADVGVPAECCIGMSRVTGELLPVLDAALLLNLNGAAA